MRANEFRLQQRRELLACYAYALLRLTELKSAWLASVADLDFKILLGHQIGYNGQMLEQLQKRLSEMFGEVKLAAPCREYAANFDNNIQCARPAEIANFAAAVLQDLQISMAAYLTRGDDVGDEPSRILLANCLSQISRQLAWLEPLVSATVSIHRVDCPDWVPRVSYSGLEPLPLRVAFPARPAELIFDKASLLKPYNETNDVLVRDAEFMRKFFYFVYLDIEIPAMEVCARNILEYRHMPLDFKLDMARQIWDEGRHAVIMKQLLVALGGKLGDYTYSCPVWNRYLLGDSLAERLAVQQVIQEGNSVEGNLEFIDALLEAGQEDTARILEYVNADEAVHARIGNQWLLFLAHQSPSEYQAIIQRALAKTGLTIPGEARLNRPARLIAAFPTWFIDSLV